MKHVVGTALGRPRRWRFFDWVYLCSSHRYEHMGDRHEPNRVGPAWYGGAGARDTRSGELTVGEAANHV
jgi:hypothetical protein